MIGIILTTEIKLDLLKIFSADIFYFYFLALQGGALVSGVNFKGKTLACN